MASTPSSADGGGGGGLKVERLGLLENAKKNKHSFIQFFAMTGILMLSLRSAGLKYRIKGLQDDTSALREEQKGLTDRMDRIKRNLLAEAAVEPTGAFASRLRALFGENGN